MGLLCPKSNFQVKAQPPGYIARSKVSAGRNAYAAYISEAQPLTAWSRFVTLCFDLLLTVVCGYWISLFDERDVILGEKEDLKTISKGLN